ncbi:hypothetical protein BBJ28_00001846 [Nothophytophthora sp. Chile5]|nr:hypothetical protein BBJ28_00001846 [Nothophytophthora sp. Chile5]
MATFTLRPPRGMAMDAMDVRDLEQFMSDDQEQQQLQTRRRQRLQALDRSADDDWALQSRLPREARALPLIRLLLESREETIPKQAMLGIWGKLVAAGSVKSTANAAVAAPKTRAKSAASIPIIRSRLLEVPYAHICSFKTQASGVRLEAAAEPHSAASGTWRRPASSRLRALLTASPPQHEESKAWKKIAQTKDRAQEILELRLATMQRQEDKALHAVERERQSRSAQKKQHCLKKESVVKKKHAAIQVISKKFQDVEQVKTESKRLKAERERLQLQQVERAREKRQSIRRQEEALKKKKQLERQHVDEEATLRLMKKAIAEERKIREHRKKVEEMEEAERTLIQRLQGTQLIQREAYSVLEQALLRTDLKRAQSVAPLSLAER